MFETTVFYVQAIALTSPRSNETALTAKKWKMKMKMKMTTALEE